MSLRPPSCTRTDHLFPCTTFFRAVLVVNVWLIASIRDQQLDARGEGLIIATIDFLGEGEEEKITGRIHNFRRGVTPYPIPGSQVFAATKIGRASCRERVCQYV